MNRSEKNQLADVLGEIAALLEGAKEVADAKGAAYADECKDLGAKQAFALGTLQAIVAEQARMLRAVIRSRLTHGRGRV